MYKLQSMFLKMDGQLFALLHGFFSLTPLNAFTFPSCLSAVQINDFLLNKILLSPHFQQFPPSRQYQTHFWKWAISHLEDLSMKCDIGEQHDFEIDTRIYEHYLSLLPPSGPNIGSSSPNTRSQICGRGIPLLVSPPAQSYITRFWSLNETSHDLPDYVDFETYYTATLLESRTTIEGGTTGLRTWFASFVLSQYLIMHPELIISKCVLELGSGVGFLGVIVATLQQLSMTANFHPLSNLPLPDLSSGSLWLSDLNDEVLSCCRDNLNLPCNMSSSHPDLNYIKLDWSASIDRENYSMSAALLHQKIVPDIILGADVVFDPSVIPALVGTLKTALGSASCKLALIALTIRNKATFEQFLNHVREAALFLENIELGFHTTPFVETVEDTKDVKILRITQP